MFYIYEVSRGNQYTLVKSEKELPFPCTEGWKYVIVEVYPTEESRDIAFRNLYLAERRDYFFIDYL